MIPRNMGSLTNDQRLPSNLSFCYYTIFSCFTSMKAPCVIFSSATILMFFKTKVHAVGLARTRLSLQEEENLTIFYYPLSQRNIFADQGNNCFLILCGSRQSLFSIHSVNVIVTYSMYVNQRSGDIVTVGR
jgi:hypothetical protein